jgi:hypothetical protein
MRIIEQGQLDDRVFTFFNSGRKWRQRHCHYHYHYAYMPRAQVFERNGGTFIEVAGVGISVEVEPDW